MKPLILLDFCVIQLSCSAGGFTGRLPSQLSYTPRCGKEHLLSFVEGCVTASTGLPAELYPHICDATGPPCSTQVISYQKPCGLSTIKIKFFLFPKTYRLMDSFQTLEKNAGRIEKRAFHSFRLWLSFLLTQLNTLANAAFEAIASIPNSFAQKSFLFLVYMTKSPNIFIETDAA